MDGDGIGKILKRLLEQKISDGVIKNSPTMKSPPPSRSQFSQLNYLTIIPKIPKGNFTKNVRMPHLN
jgi:hypothetical protein